MEEKFNVMALIAERKILEAIELGMFDDLPGAGKPLPEDDLANLPDDLRLAWRILRGSGYTDKSPSPGQPGTVNDLLGQATDEGQANRKLTRLKLRMDKKNAAAPKRLPQNDGSGPTDILESDYLDKLLQKIR
ncbi:MAG: DUF1992 domain-containing protein [Deltaproteobacteria bacterium]|jgi:hypothetical protein|nr:DUF1992 domain-containing protein [Deltaproteobacteria bacterium]